MLKRIKFIPTAVGLYTLAVGIYMGFHTKDDVWVSYYWLVNKSFVLSSLLFSKIKTKTETDELFIDFSIWQSIFIITYFIYGKNCSQQWFDANEFTVYSWTLCGFIALFILWKKLRNNAL